MRCSYCKSDGHRINDCQKCPIDRAIEIFNNKQDPLANKRKKQIQKYIGRHPETWFKECDKYPSELGVWNSKVLYDMLNNNDNWYAEYYVILILRDLTKTLFENILNMDEYHIGIPYIIKRYSSDITSDDCYIKLSLDSNLKKVVTQTYSYMNGTALYRQYYEDVTEANNKLVVIYQQQYNKHYNQDIERRRNNLYLNQAPIEAEECSICLEKFGPTNRTVLRCGHQYCNDCIFRHYSSSSRGNECPCCRREYVLRDEK